MGSGYIRIPRSPIIAHAPLHRILDDCGGVHVVAHPKLHCRHRQVNGLIVRPQELCPQRRQRVALFDREDGVHSSTTTRVLDGWIVAAVRLGDSTIRILGATMGCAGTSWLTPMSVRLGMWATSAYTSSNCNSISRRCDSDSGRTTR